MSEQQIADLKQQLSDERTLADTLADALRCLLERIKTEPDMGKLRHFMSFDTKLRRDVDDQGEFIEVALHEDINAAWDAYYKHSDVTKALTGEAG